MLNARQRRALHNHAEAVELIAEYGAGRTAELLDVHPATVKRWLAAPPVPAMALIALRAAVLGQVPGMEGRPWRGWSFGRDGRLYDETGRSYASGDILAQQYERALIRSLQADNRELRAKLTKALADSNGAANDADLAVMPRSR